MATLLSRWLPPVLWMGVIFWFSSLSTLPSPEIIWWDFILKKSAHMFIFGMQFFWWQRALRSNKKKLTKQAAITSLLLTVAYACFDEWHQSLTPGRHPRVYDVGFDTAGALISYLLIKKFDIRL